MKLVSYPTNYSSLFDDNYFRFEEVDASTPTEILFLREDGEPLGARRYVGREVIETSPKSLLRRVLAPQPRAAAKCEFVAVDDRDVALMVVYNENSMRTPTARFTACHTPLDRLALFGLQEQKRTISRGEFDEVAITAPAGVTLEAYCSLAGGTKRNLARMLTGEREGVWLLTIHTDHLLSVVGAVGEECDVEVVVNVAGNLLAHIGYTIEPRRRGDVRLAWIDPYGAISYHTFHRTDPEQILSLRTECQTSEGTQFLSLEGWSDLRLGSGYLSAAEWERVSAVVTAPKVWVVEEGFIPAVLSSSKALYGVGEGYTVELSVRPAKKTTFW